MSYVEIRNWHTVCKLTLKKDFAQHAHGGMNGTLISNEKEAINEMC
jgi:hypothetical protein